MNTRGEDTPPPSTQPIRSRMSREIIPQSQTGSATGRWQQLGHRQRCKIVGRARQGIAAACDELSTLCESGQRTDPIETVSGELIPLCAAIDFIRRRGAGILRTRTCGWLGRPVWLWGVRSEVIRVARGDVLILAAWNYPLLLPGVQIAQALAAGNRVFVKPAPGCEAVSRRLADCFIEAGVPDELLCVLPSATQAAIDQIDEGVDLVVLTGSAATGRAVLRQCAETLTPTIMELSGCDAVIIGPGADLENAAAAIRFGLMFNSGATCIGPRRIFVHQAVKPAFIESLRREFAGVTAVQLHPAAAASVRAVVDETISKGATNVLAVTTTDAENFSPIIFDGVSSDWTIASGDIFAPVSSLISYDDLSDAVLGVNRCRYRLAASVFANGKAGRRIAAQLDVGSVTINDIIFPTADPRLPFGGRGQSGFSVTRGVEGLVEMTVPKVVAIHRGRLRLHLMPRKPGYTDALAGSLTLTHGRISEKLGALRRIFRGLN